jgi:hypothetical protein
MGKFLDNRLKFHTASRVGAQTGYSLAQALDPDGHIVRHNSVWTAETSEFPMNVSKTTDPKDATDDLVEVFTGSKTPTAADATLGAGVTVRRSIGTGKVYRNSNYPAVELFYQVPMSGVANSDGEASGGTYQSYEIQEGDARVMNWCAPTAVINPTTGKPVAGFSGIAEASKDGSTWTVLQKVSNWALATGTWEFVYIAGILMFEPSVTPSKLSYTSVRFTGFRYIGATMDKTIGSKVDTTTYTTKIGELEGKINNIQFTWDEDEPVFVGYRMTNPDAVYSIARGNYTLMEGTTFEGGPVYTSGEAYMFNMSTGPGTTAWVIMDEIPEQAVQLMDMHLFYYNANSATPADGTWSINNITGAGGFDPPVFEPMYN